MRRLAVLVALCLTGCGDDGPGDREPPSISAVKRCLEGKGLQALGGAAQPSPDDKDAPDRGELITRGAFIAFYSSEELADERAAAVKTNANRVKSTVERHGTVTVVYVDTKSQNQIEACLDS